MDLWTISREERAGHDVQFAAIAPGCEFITGQQARDFFIRSGLPSPVLAQIWGLVVKGNEGKMHKKEFSIAMALITRKLKGFDVPATLPVGLTRDPVATGFAPPTSAAVSMSPAKKTTSTLGVDWTIPQNHKLKFTQLFNQHDKQRMGFLTGAQARPLLLNSNLPQPVLAQVWSLADYDKDGKLSADEFCVAMHLIDMAKGGETLPPTLPMELLPYRRKISVSQGASNGSGGADSTLNISGNAGDLRSLGISQTLIPVSQPGPGVGGGGGAAPAGDEADGDPISSPRPVTFEDRRKENFDKGNEELEKRRRALQETLMKEQAMREAHERAEAEKRERIKQEQERRRQLEMEKQMARQREIEEEKEEQRKRALEQREAARRELERQRQQEWLRQRKSEMEEKKNAEMTKVRGLKAKSNDLVAEHQSLADKSSQLVKDIEEARDQVTAQTRTIDGMRESRDEKLATIQGLNAKLMDAKRQLAATPGYLGKPLTQDEHSLADNHENILKNMANKRENVAKLQTEFSDVDRTVQDTSGQVTEMSKAMKMLQEQIEELQAENMRLEQDQKAKHSKVVDMKTQNDAKKTSNAFGADIFGAPSKPAYQTQASFGFGTSDSSWSAFGDQPAATTTSTTTTTTGPKMSQFRAVYKFEARNEDELSLNPGDIVEVDESQEADPGWMGGRLNGKTGWFPESYVEKAQEGGETATVSFEPAKEPTVDPFSNDAWVKPAAATSAPSPFDALRNAFESAAKAPSKSATPTFNGSTNGDDAFGSAAASPFGASDLFAPPASSAASDLFAPPASSGASDLFSPPASSASSAAPFAAAFDSPAPVSPSPAPSTETVTVRRCVSLYPFYSSEEGDLNFDAGVTIEIVSADGDWWTGTLGDKTGIFPANYAKEIESVAKTIPAAKPVVTSSANASFASPPHASFGASPVQQPSSGKMTPRQGILKASSSSLMSQGNDSGGGDSRGGGETSSSRADSRGPPRSRRESGKTRELELAVVIASYEATGPEQISLVEGQMVAVRKKNPSGWWEGELQIRGPNKKRQIGWFPGDYVRVERVVDSRSLSTTPNPEPVSIAAAAAAVAASVNASTYSDAFSASASASPQLAQQQQSQQQQMSPSPVVSAAIAVESVTALYNYTAMNDDELSFLKGQIITNVRKDEADWWKGDLLQTSLGSAVVASGLFPSNYVQALAADANAASTSSAEGTTEFGSLNVGDEKMEMLPVFEQRDVSQRQAAILELIATEETYRADVSVVVDAFKKPLASLMTREEIDAIFVNWHEISQANDKLLRALRVRKKTCRKNAKRHQQQQLNNDDIIMIGDLLNENMPHFASYIRYCSCQLTAGQKLQRRLEQDPVFKDALQRCSQHPGVKGMPLSSFLLKPMQRITKYPLLIKQILKYTPENHPDYDNVKQAFEKAEELCVQVNEGVREKENSERLEWLQTNVKCEPQSADGDLSSESIVFNSLTNNLGPRKFLHAGSLVKAKSGKELVGFLFNDFLLLTVPAKPSSKPFVMDVDVDVALKTYRKPLFLNEVEVPSTAAEDEDSGFTLIYGVNRESLRLVAPSRNEKLTWVRKILHASKSAFDTEKKMMAIKEHAKRVPAVGRLLFTIVDAKALVDKDGNGFADPYCHATMGRQENRTSVAPRTLSPVWNASMQFLVHDLDQDVLCLTVYDKDYFTPDDFMGRAEIPIKDIHASLREREPNDRGPISKQVQLNEVANGELLVKLDLQLFNQ